MIVKNIPLPFSKPFLEEMAHKMTAAEKCLVEVNSPNVTISVLCENENLFNIFCQWVNEIKPLGANVMVLRL